MRHPGPAVPARTDDVSPATLAVPAVQRRPTTAGTSAGRADSTPARGFVIGIDIIFDVLV